MPLVLRIPVSILFNHPLPTQKNKKKKKHKTQIPSRVRGFRKQHQLVGVSKLRYQAGRWTRLLPAQTSHPSVLFFYSSNDDCLPGVLHEAKPQVCLFIPFSTYGTFIKVTKTDTSGWGKENWSILWILKEGERKLHFNSRSNKTITTPTF